MVDCAVPSAESKPGPAALIRAAAAAAGVMLAPLAARAEPPAHAPTHTIAHAIAMHGAPALPADVRHMPYANPDAPKGGRIVHGVLGTFDSLNPFIVKGIAVQQVRGYVVESLMARGHDEPFTLYGLLAESVETDAARSFVTFRLNPRARFSAALARAPPVPAT